MPLTFEVTIDDIRVKFLKIESEPNREMEYIKVVVPFDFMTSTNEVWKSSEKTFMERPHPQSEAAGNIHLFRLDSEDAEWLKDFTKRVKQKIMDMEGISG